MSTEPSTFDQTVSWKLNGAAICTDKVDCIIPLSFNNDPPLDIQATFNSHTLVPTFFVTLTDYSGTKVIFSVGPVAPTPYITTSFDAKIISFTPTSSFGDPSRLNRPRFVGCGNYPIPIDSYYSDTRLIDCSFSSDSLPPTDLGVRYIESIMIGTKFLIKKNEKISENLPQWIAVPCDPTNCWGYRDLFNGNGWVSSVSYETYKDNFNSIRDISMDQILSQ